jgi:natural product precursor
MAKRKLSLRKERLTELEPEELARVNGGTVVIKTQLCNCTGTSHPVTGLNCIITLDPCLSS